MILGAIQELKNVNIRPGSVFRMTFYPSDKVRPKGERAISRTKYFVIVGIDADGNYTGVTLINTNVNPNFAKTIAPYQHCIYPDCYDFLNDQYRYIDCYTMRAIGRSRILETAEYIGYIEEKDLKAVIDLLKSSPAVTTAMIEQYNL